MAADTRERILRGACELAGDDRPGHGVTISLDAVARRVGLTKPGLMYHFPTKEALMVGLVEYVAERWDHLLREHCGGGPETLTAFERTRAYVTVWTTAEVSRADYWVFSDALYHPRLAREWHRRLSPWNDLAGLAAEAASLLTAARFCADGAWMAEATGVFRAADLTAVRRHALGLVDAAEAGG